MPDAEGLALIDELDKDEQMREVYARSALAERAADGTKQAGQVLGRIHTQRVVVHSRHVIEPGTPTSTPSATARQSGA